MAADEFEGMTRDEIVNIVKDDLYRLSKRANELGGILAALADDLDALR